MNTFARRGLRLIAAASLVFSAATFAQENPTRAATGAGLVTRPTAMAIDEFGRMYVAEAPADGHPGEGDGGRVLRLEDKDGDGAFETAVTFATGLHWPTGLVCWNGGVYVADTPDVLFLEDIHGDGTAEYRESVLTGFGGGAPADVLGALSWGEDLRVHGHAGAAPAQVRRSAAPNDSPLELTGKSFTFDPRTLEISHEAATAESADAAAPPSPDVEYHVLQRYAGPRGAAYAIQSHCCGVEPNDYTGSIVVTNAPAAASPDKAGTALSMLAEGGPWECATASRILYATQDTSAAPRLEELLHGSPKVEVRIAALRTLSGIGSLSVDALDGALSDASPEVRIAALQLAAPRILEGSSGAVQQHATALAADSDPGVRRQAAISLRVLPLWLRAAAYARLCATGADDAATRAAVVAGIGNDAPALLNELLTSATFTSDAKNEPVLTALARATGATAAAANAMLVIFGAPEPLRPTLVAALARGACEGRNWTLLQRLSEDKGPLGEAMAEVFTQARGTAVDSAAAVSDRVAAITLLGRDPNADGVVATLTGALTYAQPIDLQVAAISALSNAPAQADVVGPVLAALPGLGPQTRKAAMDLLLSRADWCLAVFDALGSGAVTLKAFDASQVAELQKHPSLTIRERAAAAFADFGVGPNAQKVAELTNVLQLKPDTAHGKQLFTENCSKCHSFAGEGFKLAPELSFMAKSGGYALLKSILDPNADVLPQYFSYTVETNDFETFTGIIAEETNTDVLVRGPSGEDHRVARDNISTFTCSEKTMMPEEWETSLGPQNITDVIGYLTETVAKPKPLTANPELAP